MLKGVSNMRRLAKVSWASAMIIAIVVSCAFAHTGECKKRVEMRQDGESDRWAERNYTTVLNNLLPSGAIAPDKFPKDLKWTVTVRIVSPFEQPECRFSMKKAYDGRVEISAIK